MIKYYKHATLLHYHWEDEMHHDHQLPMTMQLIHCGFQIMGRIQVVNVDEKEQTMHQTIKNRNRLVISVANFPPGYFVFMRRESVAKTYLRFIKR